ncbi:MAG: ABC transporter ATP-binding protein [Desulfitobacteriaceae bacterium]|nr:ABC transporter ATP-binding protein [Desulfitobacteriaceae bacterium]MDD4345536.1 ABC transporter ATP-binding protein [Desulfitobacteriaceae bacterium]MDD4401655.1 ABC transporter ATP-binding protein [Desulfitobacteriaceae bacterium]
MFLEVSGLTKHFGGVMAVEHIKFNVNKGEIFALIGPNGAGKTTVFNLLTGMIPPDEGGAKFKGKNLVGLKPYQIRNIGIARTFQNLQLFNSLSVLENVMVGAYLSGRKGFIQSLLRLSGVAAEEEQVRKKSLEVIEELGLGKDINNPASVLPFGKQRLLEIARVLAGSPELLFLDEPASGLNVGETKKLANYLKKLKKDGFTLVLVEHDMETVMNVADRILVLNFGTVIAEGTPEEIQRNDEVKKAYLGEEDQYEYSGCKWS